MANQTVPAVAWVGDPPTTCDLCQMPIGRVFIDGRTRMGPWGCLCPSCHTVYGYGLGTGRGQRFERKRGGRFVKVGG